MLFIKSTEQKDSKIILNAKTEYLEIVYYIFYVINYIIISIEM